MTGTDRPGYGPFARWSRETVRHWVPYVGGVAALFSTAAILGAAVGSERASPLVPIRAPGDPVPVLDPLSLFLHNANVTGLIVLGTLFFGVPSLYLVAYNGFLFGGALVAAIDSLGPVAAVALLAPHGVVEIPALWLAGAIAARWLHVIWQTAQGGDRRVPVGRTVVETVVAIAVVVLALLVAALVEGTITAELARTLT